MSYAYRARIRALEVEKPGCNARLFMSWVFMSWVFMS